MCLYPALSTMFVLAQECITVAVTGSRTVTSRQRVRKLAAQELLDVSERVQLLHSQVKS